MIEIQKDEKILGTIRKHWLVFFFEGVSIFISAFFPLLFILIASFFVTLNISSSVFYAGTFFYLIWLIFMWIWFFLAWTDFYLDTIIVTNKKIIVIDQRGLFSRETSNFDIDRIQDITIDVHGIIATLFNFGDIHIQTAGAGDKRVFILHNAGKPHAARELISQNSEGMGALK